MASLYRGNAQSSSLIGLYAVDASILIRFVIEVGGCVCVC